MSSKDNCLHKRLLTMIHGHKTVLQKSPVLLNMWKIFSVSWHVDFSSGLRAENGVSTIPQYDIRKLPKLYKVFDQLFYGNITIELTKTFSRCVFTSQVSYVILKIHVNDYYCHCIDIIVNETVLSRNESVKYLSNVCTFVENLCFDCAEHLSNRIFYSSAIFF